MTKVIIVGAGIGGLAAALRLHQAGIDCAVYEQAAEIRELGVGINLMPHAVRELTSLGLLDQLDQVGIRTGQRWFTTRQGRVIWHEPCGIGAGFDHPQISIHRGQLQHVLLHAVRDRLGPDAVRTGHHLTGFVQTSYAVHATFVDSDGRARGSAHGDVLVGADGIHSTVRSALSPAEGRPAWTGVTMWRGATDWPAFGAEAGKTMVIAGGNSPKLVVYPIAPSTTPGDTSDASSGTMLTNWALCLQTGLPDDPVPEQNWSRRVTATQVQDHAASFHTPPQLDLDHVGLITATQDVFEFPMAYREPLRRWSLGRVTLLGDAAHAMPPMGSNGAAQALLDGASLTRHLTHHTDPVMALRTYEDERLPATRDLLQGVLGGGPERINDEAEQREISDEEITAIMAEFERQSGQGGRP